MNKFALLTVVLSLSIAAIAQEYDDFQFEDNSDQADTAQLIEAPREVVTTATENCKTWAKDEDIDAAELKTSLLYCVNEELEYQGYLPVGSISE